LPIRTTDSLSESPASTQHSGGDREAPMNSPRRVSIVVPLFDDEAGLPALFDRLRPVMGSLGESTELILVDDGSRDGTTRVATELARDYPFRTTVVRLARNFGQHPAVFAGFEHCVGDVVVTMDSDLQYPPEEIPRLVHELSPEFPVVSGSRVQRADPWARRLITRTLSRWLSRKTGSSLSDYGSMFRAYERRVVDQLLIFREQRRFVPALVGWLGVPVKEIPVTHHERGERGSRYRLAPLVDMFLDLITGYATFPLRLVTLTGLIGAVLGLLATLSLLVYRIVAGIGPSGLVTAFALLFFLLGIQLFILGLMGEYVGRIYVEAKARPYFLVGEVIRNR
jgi:undecaprenyl-phosphate 4-deoxy-4-formamido-L-arabinose transferase